MSDSSILSSLSIADGDRTMTVLARHLERFVDAWEEGGDPPELARYLPESGDLRRLALIEMVKIDLEYRWLEHNIGKRIAEYAAEFPELSRPNVPADLIYEEFHIRKQSGIVVDPRDYLDAFPEQARELERLLAIDEPFESTGLFTSGKQKLIDEISVGERLDDFDLVAKLGKGAFASVFLAMQRSMQRLVALKVSADSGTEPQTLAQLDHDHIVRVFDQRILPGRSLRLLYMQYISGGTLQAVVHKAREQSTAERNGKTLLDVVDQAIADRGESRPVDSRVRERHAKSNWFETVCWIGSRLALALDYAHKRGVLHRDVKPANVLLTGEGVPKLADFNISFSSKLAGATPAAYFGGSLAYMSPEQLEACNPRHDRQPESLDGRSDLYSLAVMLWELLCGLRPFDDDEVRPGWPNTLDAMIVRRREGVSASRKAILPEECPAGLRAVLLKALDADPDARWSTGAEFAKQLELCRDPATQDLVYPPADSRRVMLRGYTTLIVVALAGLVHGVMGWSNWAYNYEWIREKISEESFRAVVFTINGVAFPVGLALGGYLVYSVQRRVTRLGTPPPLSSEELPATRQRCLRLGHYSALIGVVEWSIAGIAYPVSLQSLGSPLSPQDYAHFFSSLLLCGLVVTAYPFFAVTFCSLRILYPPLVHCDMRDLGDIPTLDFVERLAGYYRAVAVAIPPITVVILLVMGLVGQEKALHQYIMLGLLACSLIGWYFVFRAHRRITADIDAYRRVLASD